MVIRRRMAKTRDEKTIEVTEEQRVELAGGEEGGKSQE